MRFPRALAPSLLALACALGAPAQEAKKPLPPPHLKGGVLCVDCHRKETPSKPASSEESCMVCHGDAPAMAAYTKHLDPNPHKPPAGKHPGPWDCAECHHQHRAPEVKCRECHAGFKFTAR